MNELLGELVRQVREAAGDNLTEAAAKVGVTRFVLSRIERGQKVHRLQDVLRKVAQAYGRPADLFLKGIDPWQQINLMLDQASVEQRAQWMALTAAERMHLTLRCLMNSPAGPYLIKQVEAVTKTGTAAAITPPQLSHLMERQEAGLQDTFNTPRLMNVLRKLPAVGDEWLAWGIRGTEPGLDAGFPMLESLVSLTNPADRKTQSISHALRVLSRMIAAGPAC